MIDIETQVMTLVHTAVTAQYPSARFESVLNLEPSGFPCVCVEEIDNTTRTSTIDSGSNENHANVAYEINIFTNDMSGKKQAAKKILALIDTAMIAKGFARTTYIPNGLDHGTKYRLLVRYQATVDKQNRIYRR